MNSAPTNFSPILRIDASRLGHVVIRASAGSGKTHELTNRYLLLLAGGEQPSRILATTFTRAAAGEIRDRLIRRLADAATSDDDRKRLAKALGVTSISVASVVEMLRRLAQTLHTLQIRTLDSFFATVVRTYAMELGLPPDCTVIDENDDRSLRREALQMMLDERDPQPLVELLRLLTRGDSTRSVTRTIDQTVSSLYELWRETDERCWSSIQPVDGLLEPAALVRAIDDLAQAPVPEDQRFAKALASNVVAAIARDWKSFLDGGLANPIVEGTMTYYKKPISAELQAVLQPLIQHAGAELVHAIVGQTRSTALLLRRFHEHYQSLKQQHGVLTFNDLTHAMIKARAGQADDGLGLMDDIGYRLDAAVHHLLLDEFQDTSSAQWRAVRDIALEISSQSPPERTFFCVGDIKQSIYGWRGATPELLARMPEVLPGVEPKTLDVSWRSSPVIIDSVNAVFESIQANPAMQGDQAHESAAELWQQSYSRHRVADRLTGAPGFVQVIEVSAPPKTNSNDKLHLRLKAAAALAAEIHAADPRVRIAILLRSNNAVARVLFELSPAHLNVPASGRGGGPLIDAPPVSVILDLLQLADHPDDTIAAFNVAASPLGAALDFRSFDAATQRRRLARSVRSSLIEHGYQQTIARWVQTIADSCDARELRRLTQLVELAGVHDSGVKPGAAGLRTAPFIELVEQREVADTQPAPIEVMTVHQAKGLEFDAVILPELQSKLTGQRTPAIMFERDDDGSITCISRYASKVVRALHPRMNDLAEVTNVRLIRESLAVLYVAMTRARHALYMMIDELGNSRSTCTHQILLRQALIGDAPSADNGIHYQSGDERWIERLAADRAKREKPYRIDEPAAVLFDSIDSKAATVGRDGGKGRIGAALPPSAARDRAVARGRARALREQLMLRPPEGRERGTVIHGLLETVEWLDDYSAADAQLLAVAKRIAPRRDDRWHQRQVRDFRDMLGKPAIRQVLSRPAKGEATLFRELPFVRTPDDLLQSGVIDRVVLQHDADGRFIAGTIIDFKTDAIVEESFEAQAETHRAQLESYRDAVAELFDVDISRLQMQVLLMGSGQVVTM